MSEKQCSVHFYGIRDFGGESYVPLETVQEILNEKEKTCKSYYDMHERLKKEMQKNCELNACVKELTDLCENLKAKQFEKENFCCECDSDDEVDLEEVIYEQQCEIERLNTTIEVLVEKFGGES